MANIINTNITKDRFNLLVENLTNGSWQLPDYENELSDILKACNFICKHANLKRSYFYCVADFNACDLSEAYVQQFLKYNHFNSNLIIQLMKLVITNFGVTFTKTCFMKNNENINQLLDICHDKNVEVIAYLSGKLHINPILKQGYCNSLYLNKVINQYKDLKTNEIFEICNDRVKNLLKYYDYETEALPIWFVENLFDKWTIETDTHNMFKVRNTNFHTVLSKILDKYDGPKIVYNQQLLYEAVESLPYSLPLVHVLLSKNLVLDDKCLDIVLEHGNCDAIKYVLDNHPIEITSEHFTKLIQSTKYIGIIGFDKRARKYFHSLSDDGYIKKKGSGYTKEGANLLFEKGYKLTKDNIKKSIEYKIELDVSKIDIDMDQEILDLCHKYQYYPNYNFNIIDPNLLELEKLCLSPKITRLETFFKNNPDTVPNEKCMINAVKNKFSTKGLQILLDNGGKITPKVLTYNPIWKRNEKDKLILRKANEYHLDKIKQLENQLAKQLVLSKLKKMNITPKELPNTKRKKMEIPIIFKEYFQVEKDRMSFYDVKKYMIDKIKKDGWLNPDLGIVLPKELTDKMGLDDGYIHMNELDSFISLFY